MPVDCSGTVLYLCVSAPVNAGTAPNAGESGGASCRILTSGANDLDTSGGFLVALNSYRSLRMRGGG